MKRLNLPDSPHALVFRAIVAQVRNDATLAESGVERWLAWEDIEDDNKALDDFQGPAVRLTPELGAMAWRYAEAQAGPLVVSIEANLPGMHGDDFMNLQMAICDALYPRDPTRAFERSLVSLGAETGQIHFVRPLSQDARSVGTSEQWTPMGTFEVDVEKILPSP